MPRTADGIGMTGKSSASLLVLVLSAAALPAQEPAPGDDPLQVAQRELEAARAELAALRARLDDPIVHGSIGTAVATEYLFRGIPQEDRGAIVQPWADLTFALWRGDDDDVVRSVELTTGIWNSLHDGPTGGSGGAWYEADVFAGLSVGLGQRWSVGAVYTVYHSPNGTFGTVEEIAATVSFDDTGLLPITLQPSVTVAFEVDGQADAGLDEGIYGEIGIAPSFSLVAGQDFELALLTPLKLGFSLRDYYERPAGGGDEAFGYLDVGVALECTLPSLPHAGTPWTLEVGLHWLVLGDSNEVRNGDGSELLGIVALGVGF